MRANVDRNAGKFNNFHYGIVVDLVKDPRGGDPFARTFIVALGKFNNFHYGDPSARTFIVTLGKFNNFHYGMIRPRER